MRGDLITKKLPKYKRDAMECIARLCFEELNPKFNDRFTFQDFKLGTYKFEGSYLTITIGGVIKIKLYGDFPMISGGVSSDNSFSYETARKIIAKVSELEKNSPIHDNGDILLITEFNLAYKYLRSVGHRGTRVQYKGE